MLLQVTTIQFPEIALRTRDAHKLRGFFGNLFKEKSELLHNHYADGSVRHRYPLVQYKVVDSVPQLVGIGEGGRLLTELFLRIKNIDIEGTTYEVLSKNIGNRQWDLSDFTKLHRYNFDTLWMGLNQKNYAEYMLMSSEQHKSDFLNKQLQNSILAFYKGVDYRISERIMATADLSERTTQFKNQTMLGFTGSFVTNAVLPDNIGIGKSVARGFGNVRKV